MGIGALLHDVGKMRIPSDILNRPGKLREKEFREIKKHLLYTLELLEKAKGISEASKHAALQHHERYNGRGYPYGLRGEEIGRFGQIVAIINVYWFKRTLLVPIDSRQWNTHIEDFLLPSSATAASFPHPRTRCCQWYTRLSLSTEPSARFLLPFQSSLPG